MKKKFSFRSAFFNPRILVTFVLCLVGVLLTLAAFGLYPGGLVMAQGPKPNQKRASVPQRIPMVGPVSQNRDLRTLPYIAPEREQEERRLMRHPRRQSLGKTDVLRAVKQSQQLVAMPTPIATFAGMSSAQSGCGCLPPDTNGDVGPNHYIQSVNSSIKIFDKAGNPLNGANGTTYNSFFSGSGTDDALRQLSESGRWICLSTISWLIAGW